MSTVQSGSGIDSKPPVPLEKPPHEIEMDRKRALLARVKMLRESAVINRGAVIERNPLKEYCWVNVKDDRRVSFEAVGWVVCKDPGVKTRWKQEDGTHRRADLILYEMDKDLFEAMKAYDVLRGIEATEGAEEAFVAAISRDNVPAYKPKVR